jgi:hypothetical protein
MGPGALRAHEAIEASGLEQTINALEDVLAGRVPSLRLPDPGMLAAHRLLFKGLPTGREGTLFPRSWLSLVGASARWVGGLKRRSDMHRRPTTGFYDFSGICHSHGTQFGLDRGSGRGGRLCRRAAPGSRVSSVVSPHGLSNPLPARADGSPVGLTWIARSKFLDIPQWPQT